MQAPRRNIELKATDPDPSVSLEVCRSLGAEDRGTIAQRDTYFEVARGGLKLREEQPGRPHLIQFERASEPQQRESRYRIIEVSDGTALCAALAAALRWQTHVHDGIRGASTQGWPVRGRYGGSKSVAEPPNPLYPSQL